MGKPNFLILRGGAIGDFVMTLPALEALRKRWPECRIEVLGYPHIASLALAGGLADSVRSLDRASVARLFVPEQPLPAAMAFELRQFDVVVNYLYDPDDSVSKSLVQAGVSQVLAVSPRMDTEPAARRLMKPLEALAVYPEGEPYPRLNLKPGAVEKGRERLAARGGRAFAIHPGSGSGRKNWPLAGFLAVAERLKAAGCEPVFSFGEADTETEQAYRKAGAPYPVLPAMDLTGLAGALACCRGYAGNDSGITHLAAATGIPVTAVFGPSDPAVWASRAPRVRVVKSALPTPESLAALPVDAVWRAVAEGLQPFEGRTE